MHFTYEAADKSCLKQGDILLKSDGICSILKEVHPHYLKPDYKYFLVLSQNCDLIQRDRNGCKSRYITIAAIRPFELLLSREVANFQHSVLEQKGELCKESQKKHLISRLDKIFNNNDSEYFYLHEDSTSGLVENSVAFLKLSISIKSELHYQTCLNAKQLELKKDFRAKLGWLVGNLYSRIGTEDWVPKTKKADEFQAMLNSILDENIVWVNDKKLEQLKKQFSEEQQNSLSRDEIRRALKETPSKTAKSVLNSRLISILQSERIDLTSDQRNLLLSLITSDTEIQSILRPQL